MTDTFTQFVEDLGGHAASVLARERSVPEALAQLSMTPQWHLVVVPDADDPKSYTFKNQYQLERALRKALELELGNVYMYFGVRALHAGGDYPHLFLPTGKAVPLYEQELVLAPSLDGAVGDEEVRVLLRGDDDEDGEYDPLAAEHAEEDDEGYNPTEGEPEPEASDSEGEPITQDEISAALYGDDGAFPDDDEEAAGPAEPPAPAPPSGDIP